MLKVKIFHFIKKKDSTKKSKLHKSNKQILPSFRIVCAFKLPQLLTNRLTEFLWIIFHGREYKRKEMSPFLQHIKKYLHSSTPPATINDLLSNRHTQQEVARKEKCSSFSSPVKRGTNEWRQSMNRKKDFFDMIRVFVVIHNKKIVFSRIFLGETRNCENIFCSVDIKNMKCGEMKLCISFHIVGWMYKK